MRKLGIPAVMERVIMQAIAWVLTSVFEPLFSESSFGFRPGRSVQDAARQAQCYYQKGYGYQINLDLEKFFDTVNHDILMNRVSRQIKDKGILRLIGTFLRAGVMVDGRLNAIRKGVPQGSPVSPILSNILLDDLDKELEKRVMMSTSRYLEETLKVKVNTQKSSICKVKGGSVLGFQIHRKKLRTIDPKIGKFKARGLPWRAAFNVWQNMPGVGWGTMDAVCCTILSWRWKDGFEDGFVWPTSNNGGNLVRKFES